MAKPAMRRLVNGHHGSRLKGGILVVALWLISALALAGCASDVSQAPSPTPTATTRPLTCEGAYKEPNPVAAENACPGTTAWKANMPHGSEDAIQAFVTPESVDAGSEVSLYVSTTAPTYTFAVYRMGYYHGAGGKLMYQSGVITGIQQPAPTVDSTTRLVECSWQDPAPIITARSWVSGIYLIKLASSTGYMRYTFFVVRNTTVHTPILYTLPFLTYQAYNLWGGYSLYWGVLPDGTRDPSLRARAVSFDRPYLSDGFNVFGAYDFPLIQWLESRSYNLTYAADYDLDAATASTNQYKLIIVSGHSEYWSAGMRANVTTARDAGVSLAFLGANDVYWHVRLASSAYGLDRIVVCYKILALDPLAQSDPQAATVRWRDAPLNQPEALLMGEQYGGGVAAPAPLTLSAGSAPYLAGTSLTSDSSLPELVGGEYDRIYPTYAPPTLRVIATSTLQCVPSSLCPANGIDTANATIYTAPSGAVVFDAGTFRWSWGLSPIGASGATQTETTSQQLTPGNYSNPGFQQMTANIMAVLLS